MFRKSASRKESLSDSFVAATLHFSKFIEKIYEYKCEQIPPILGIEFFATRIGKPEPGDKRTFVLETKIDTQGLRYGVYAYITLQFTSQFLWVARKGSAVQIGDKYYEDTSDDPSHITVTHICRGTFDSEFVEAEVRARLC